MDQPIEDEAIPAPSQWGWFSFEEFLYRFWLENTIWFALRDETPLTEAQQRYLAHYAKK